MKALTREPEDSWIGKHAFQDEKVKGYYYVLSQTEPNSINDNFMKIEVFKEVAKEIKA